MRADRLISMLLLLQTRGRMTAHDLAQHLEVSERTIYRDLDALCMAGIPLYTERGPGGGCSLLGGYQTRLTGLTETEQRALFLATLAGPPSQLGMEKAFEDALLKVSAALPESSHSNVEFTRQRFHVDAAWWYHNPHTTPCMQTLQEAVWHDSMLFIRYSEEDDSQQSYLIEPYGLVTKVGDWYLIGMCEGEQYVLRVSRISQVENTRLSFTRSSNFDLATSWEEYRARLEAGNVPFAAALRIAPDEAHTLSSVLEEWGYEQVKQSKTIAAKPSFSYPQVRGQQKNPFLYPRTAITKEALPSKKPILFFYPSQKMTRFVVAWRAGRPQGSPCPPSNFTNL